MQKTAGTVAALLFAALCVACPAFADDTLKIAVADLHAWESQPVVQGRELFRKHGIAVAVTGKHGAADALQEVLDGGADVATGIDTAIALRAYAGGAAIHILMPSLTGADDLYWYVKADSPITSFSGATEANTVAYSTAGSLTQLVVTEFAQPLRIKAKPVATGSPAATLAEVLSGAVDIGWGRAPFGLKEIAEGKIRIVAQGVDIAPLKARTARVIVVRAEMLQKKRDALARFAHGYRDAVAWLYFDTRAIKAYAESVHLPQDAVEASVRKSFPKQALQTDSVSGLDDTMWSAVRQKTLDAVLTGEQVKELIAIPGR